VSEKSPNFPIPLFPIPDALVVPPVSKLQYKGAVTNKKRVGVIIISVHEKQVRGGAITPLQPCIKIDVLLLVIVLDEGG